MKKLLIALSLGLVACGNASSDPRLVPSKPGTDGPPSEMNSSTPDPTGSQPEAGYTRFTPTAIKLAPGEEGMWCQWVAGPAEEDVDIMDIKGEQSFPGHHAVIFATPVAEAAGTTRLCNSEDEAQMKLLGGIGGEGSGNAFPAGAVVRLKKGQSLMMNTHYLNTSNEKVTGEARLDVKFEAPSPEHRSASFFMNVSANFALTPQGETKLDISCVLKHDVQLLDWTNHMHEFGQSVFTEVIHQGGGADDLQRDLTWQHEWQFNGPRHKWSVDAPRVLKAGDTLHTQCTWKNTTPDVMTFPREMCLSFGFALGEKEVVCNDGKWME